MNRKLHGVCVPHRKNTASLAAVRLPAPPVVTIPMSMHIGAPARPVVQAGDEVKVGQLIAEAGGFVSSPIYASVSGKVKKLGELLGSNGRSMQTVVIESDGRMTPKEDLAAPKLDSLQDFLDAVRASGAVGLGGAGFPTAVKLTVKDPSQIKAVIVNGAECEPYITSDTRTMETTVFILVIAALVQLVEIILKKYIPSLHKALGVYLPLITTNCGVLGVTMNNISDGFNFRDSVLTALGCGLGFFLAMSQVMK